MELPLSPDTTDEGSRPLVDPFQPPPPAATETPARAPDGEDERPPPGTLRAILHHSFVEYDPRYLASAVLVLGGLTLLSCDLGQRDALAGLGLSVVAELYALLLIAGAAMLRRVGQARMAVMLGLIAVAYQCDLTLHVERCSLLGALGLAAALGWVALFALKLRLLCAALGLRASRTALAVAISGAAFVALTPIAAHVLWRWAHDARAIGLFLAIAPGLFVARPVESEAGFDYRGRRALHGTWALWGAAAIAHALFDGIDAIVLGSVLLLFATRWARRERAFWALIGLALLPVLLDPRAGGTFAITLLTSITLALRALRTASDPASVVPPAPVPSPYRGGPAEVAVVVPALREPSFAPADEPWRSRTLVVALALAHLSFWRALGSEHALGHVLVVDLLLALACAAWIARARRPLPVLALAPTVLHALVGSGTLRAPRGPAEWGAAAVAVGFGLLGSALATTYWKERFTLRASFSANASPGFGGKPDAPR